MTVKAKKSGWRLETCVVSSIKSFTKNWIWFVAGKYFREWFEHLCRFKIKSRWIFADSRLQRGRNWNFGFALFWIFAKFKWKISLNENMHLPLKSSNWNVFCGFNNVLYFQCFSWFSLWRRNICLNVNLYIKVKNMKLTTSHFVLKKLDHVVICARSRYLALKIEMITTFD